MTLPKYEHFLVKALKIRFFYFLFFNFLFFAKIIPEKGLIICIVDPNLKMFAQVEKFFEPRLRWAAAPLYERVQIECSRGTAIKWIVVGCSVFINQ